MQTVRDAKNFLRVNQFKNLKGEDLDDDSILYPCG